MNYYLAPMEGLTTYVFRNAYNKYFGDIDKYFTPFIASKKMNSRELNDILPEHNNGLNLVPQILTNRDDEFLQITNTLKDYGYTTVNLNLGCPSGTVTSRKRGAGFLSVPTELDKFLYEIYDKSPLNISIKTRIGIDDLEDWTELLKIYNKYPVSELIIHPRLQKEFYSGTPHKSAYIQAKTQLQIPLCYNGDLNSVAAYNDLLNEIPDVSSVMIGRGLLQTPILIKKIKDSCNDNYKAECYKTILKSFHDEIFENYSQIMSGETNTLYKMKDLWTYLNKSFTNPDKYLKKIRKANSFSDYKTAVNALFREQEINTYL